MAWSVMLPPTGIVGAETEVAIEVAALVEAAVQVGTEITFASRVTAPFLASTLPLTFASVNKLAEVRARIVPSKVELVPKTAELPTCQKTLHA